MARIIAIDLGTTYSAVAVPEEHMADGFFVAPECPGCSIVLDNIKRRITPSVVAENNQGEIVVGYPAKSRAGFSPEPIMFSKRWMGEDHTFPLKRQGNLNSEDAAMHILRFLKQMAEHRLHDSVEEAVISVPAYFSLQARDMTKRAAERAGLRAAKIVQEPVAAALMYCAGDPRETLTILTYDLGGGTFDVSLLERRDGVIGTDSIRGFDGDRFLGGYNFDVALARWILEKLNENGYKLELDLEDPDHRVIWAKLLVYAERAKIELSRSESAQIQEPNTGIEDLAGNAVEIQLEVSRQQFEAMIHDDVEHSIGLCRRLLEEKCYRPVKPDEIDEIIMVGGSSRIPLIARRLEEVFGRRPRLVEPDLCVALGAAVLAGAVGKAYGCLKVDPIPQETDALDITVTGQVTRVPGVTDAGPYSVSLRALDGSYHERRSVGAGEMFAFDRVPLAPDVATDFALAVRSPAGEEIASHAFTVLQTAQPEERNVVALISNVLSKPVAIQGVNGLQVVAPERSPLPFESPPIKATTSDQSGAIRIPICEEHTPLGEIVMTYAPESLPLGSEVEIYLTIGDDYQVCGRASVPKLGREVEVTIAIPVPPRKSLEELRQCFALLSARADEARAMAGPAALFANAKVKRLHDRRERCAKMLAQKPADLAAIQDCLDEIESLVRAISAGWKPDPTREIFQEKDKQVDRLIQRAVQSDASAAQRRFDKRLEAIRAEAERAYTAQDPAAWSLAYQKLEALGNEAASVIASAEREVVEQQGPPPGPADYLFQLERELAALDEEFKKDRRYPEFESEFDELADALTAIDPEKPDAMARIRDWYNKFNHLRRRLDKTPKPEAGGRVRLKIPPAPAG